MMQREKAKNSNLDMLLFFEFNSVGLLASYKQKVDDSPPKVRSQVDKLFAIFNVVSSEWNKLYPGSKQALPSGTALDAQYLKEWNSRNWQRTAITSLREVIKKKPTWDFNTYIRSPGLVGLTQMMNVFDEYILNLKSENSLILRMAQIESPLNKENFLRLFGSDLKAEFNMIKNGQEQILLDALLDRKVASSDEALITAAEWEDSVFVKSMIAASSAKNFDDFWAANGEALKDNYRERVENADEAFDPDMRSAANAAWLKHPHGVAAASGAAGLSSTTSGETVDLVPRFALQEKWNSFVPKVRTVMLNYDRLSQPDQGFDGFWLKNAGILLASFNNSAPHTEVETTQFADLFRDEAEDLWNDLFPESSTVPAPGSKKARLSLGKLSIVPQAALDKWRGSPWQNSLMASMRGRLLDQDFSDFWSKNLQQITRNFNNTQPKTAYNSVEFNSWFSTSARSLWNVLFPGEQSIVPKPRRKASVELPLKPAPIGKLTKEEWLRGADVGQIVKTLPVGFTKDEFLTHFGVNPQNKDTSLIDSYETLVGNASGNIINAAIGNVYGQIYLPMYGGGIAMPPKPIRPQATVAKPAISEDKPRARRPSVAKLIKPQAWVETPEINKLVAANLHSNANDFWTNHREELLDSYEKLVDPTAPLDVVEKAAKAAWQKAKAAALGLDSDDEDEDLLPGATIEGKQRAWIADPWIHAQYASNKSWRAFNDAYGALQGAIAIDYRKRVNPHADPVTIKAAAELAWNMYNPPAKPPRATSSSQAVLSAELAKYYNDKWKRSTGWQEILANAVDSALTTDPTTSFETFWKQSYNFLVTAFNRIKYGSAQDDITPARFTTLFKSPAEEKWNVTGRTLQKWNAIEGLVEWQEILSSNMEPFTDFSKFWTARRDVLSRYFNDQEPESLINPLTFERLFKNKVQAIWNLKKKVGSTQGSLEAGPSGPASSGSISSSGSEIEPGEMVGFTPAKPASSAAALAGGPGASGRAPSGKSWLAPDDSDSDSDEEDPAFKKAPSSTASLAGGPGAQVPRGRARSSTMVVPAPKGALSNKRAEWVRGGMAHELMLAHPHWTFEELWDTDVDPEGSNRAQLIADYKKNVDSAATSIVVESAARDARNFYLESTRPSFPESMPLKKKQQLISADWMRDWYAPSDWSSFEAAWKGLQKYLIEDYKRRVNPYPKGDEVKQAAQAAWDLYKGGKEEAAAPASSSVGTSFTPLASSSVAPVKKEPRITVANFINAKPSFQNSYAHEIAVYFSKIVPHVYAAVLNDLHGLSTQALSAEWPQFKQWVIRNGLLVVQTATGRYSFKEQKKAADNASFYNNNLNNKPADQRKFLGFLYALGYIS
jgi:hypothetical protein